MNPSFLRDEDVVIHVGNRAGGRIISSEGSVVQIRCHDTQRMTCGEVVGGDDVIRHSRVGKGTDGKNVGVWVDGHLHSRFDFCEVFKGQDTWQITFGTTLSARSGWVGRYVMVRRQRRSSRLSNLMLSNE